MALFRIDGTPGPSTFGATADHYFEKTVDGADPLYEAIYIADAIDVVSSQFVLDSASPSDWQTCGMWLNPIGAALGGGIGAYSESGFLNLGQSEGSFYMETVFHPTTESMADISYAPLFWLTAPNSDQILGVFIGDPGTTPYLEVWHNLYFGDGGGWWSGADEPGWDFTFGSEHHPVAGQPYKVRLEWQCGTHDGSTHAFDGWFKVYINDALVTEKTNIRLYLSLNTNPVDMVAWAAIGFDGTLGPWDYFEIDTLDSITPPPVVPPMQRAGYVLFSNDIVEKQTVTKLTRMHLQAIIADPPPAVAPGTLTLTEVVGSLYDQEGNVVTVGKLIAKPRASIIVNGHLIAAKSTEYTVTGPISFYLAPSDGVLYDVQYDSDPDDTSTPINLKDGYWRDIWSIPALGPVNISEL